MDMKAVNRQAIIDIIRMLEKKNGVPEALTFAVQNSAVGEIERLIANGADVNVCTKHGTTPLMSAGNQKTARVLLAHGADVNAQTPDGRTPLICYLNMLDSPSRAESYVKFLLKSGADPSIVAHDGTTAFDIAQAKYGARVADLLARPGESDIDDGLGHDNSRTSEPDKPMAAAGWTHYCPYTPDAEAALQRLRQEVFARGNYRMPGDILAEFDDESMKSISPDLVKLRKMVNLAKGLDRAFADIGSDTSESGKRTREMEAFLDKAEREGFASAARATLKSKASHKPSSIEEALELAEEEGTRSILDIDRISDVSEIGAAAPLSEPELTELFGTTEPTLEMVQATAEELVCLRECGTAVYCVVYCEGRPVQYVFAGTTGD